MLDLAGVTAELLTKPDGRGILQVRAANLKNGIEFLRLFVQSRAQIIEGWEQIVDNSIQGREVNRRGNYVVARLAAIDMVVRMNRLIAAFPTAKLASAIGNYFIGVHVGRSARAGLKNIQGKLGIQFAIDNLLD